MIRSLSPDISLSPWLVSAAASDPVVPAGSSRPVWWRGWRRRSVSTVYHPPPTPWVAEYCPVSPASHPVPRLYLHQNDNHDDDDDVHDDHHHDYDIDNDDDDGASPVDAGADLGLEDVSSLSITTGLLYLTRENVVPAPDSSPMIVCSLVISIIFSNSPRNYINHMIV